MRGRVGVLFQDFASYELSVRENVQMGRPGAIADDSKVLAALLEHGIAPERLVLNVTSTPTPDHSGGASMRFDAQTSSNQPGQQHPQAEVVNFLARQAITRREPHRYPDRAEK